MIDICMALDQSVSPHTGVRTIQNTGVFWQAVFQPPRPYSLFLEHGSPAKTLISHPHNTASYAGYKMCLQIWIYMLLNWGKSCARLFPLLVSRVNVNLIG